MQAGHVEGCLICRPLGKTCRECGEWGLSSIWPSCRGVLVEEGLEGTAGCEWGGSSLALLSRRAFEEC